MLAGLLIFWVGRDNYSTAAGLDITEDGMKPLGLLKTYQVISIGSLALIPLCYFLISQNEWMTYLLTALFVYIAISMVRAGIKEGTMWRDRMIALIIFMIINTVFWACFEQAGASLTLFADRNETVKFWDGPYRFDDAVLQSCLYHHFQLHLLRHVGQLDQIGKNPSIPMKFALGILQLSAVSS